MTTETPDTLECNTCGQTLPAEAFRQDGRSAKRGYRSVRCRGCDLDEVEDKAVAAGVLPLGWHIGGRVRIVETAPGWTSTEKAYYGGRLGHISGVSTLAAAGPRSILVTIYGGPCDGEARWFTAEELAVVEEGKDGRA